MAPETLTDEGRRLLAELRDWIGRSEERLAYRREKGRNLSRDHYSALEEALATVKALEQRLEAIMRAPLLEEEMERFQGLQERLERLGSGGS